MNALRWLAMAIIVVLIGLFGFGLTRDATLIPSPLVGEPVPSFRLPQLDLPDSVSFDDLRGQVAVMNFWASWCLACKREHPALVRAWQRYAAREVTFVGVLYQDTRENARRYLAEHGGGWMQLVDSDTRTAIEFGVYGVPETFFIDQRGVIAHKHIGPVTDEILAREIDRLLGPRAARPANGITESTP